MGNFAKLVITAGLIGLGCFIFVLFQTQEHQAKSDLFRARHEQKMLDFDRDFDRGWNADEMYFANTKEERESIIDREQAQREKYAAESERVQQRIDDAQARVERKSRVSESFTDSFEQALEEIPDISEEEFRNAIKELD